MSFCEPDEILKKQIKDAGLNYRDVCRGIRVPYTTLSHNLNGYTSMPYFRRKQIEDLIESRRGAV